MNAPLSAKNPFSIISKPHLFQEFDKLTKVWSALLKFCDSIWYWVLASGLSVVEPVIVSCYPISKVGIAIQTTILTVSTFCFVLLLCADRGFDEPAFTGSFDLLKNAPMTNFTVAAYKHFQHLYSRGDYIFELCCFLIGWIFLFSRPGIAALRCFRVFRILWYPEIDLIHFWVLSRKGKVLGGTLTVLVRASRFAVSSLIALGREMFTLTKATHGGLLIGLMFFYSAFVMGTALWLETGDSLSQCRTMGSCMYTMMRLTFYDGNGFDYAFSLSADYPFLFYLTMFYLCVTSFGMLNGLIGIFGTAFTDSTERVYLARPYAPPCNHTNESTDIYNTNRSGRFGGGEDNSYRDAHCDAHCDGHCDGGGVGDGCDGGAGSNGGGMFKRRHSARYDSNMHVVLVQQLAEISRTQNLLIRRLDSLDFDMKTLRKEQLKASRKSSLYGRPPPGMLHKPSPTKKSPQKRDASKKTEAFESKTIVENIKSFNLNHLQEMPSYLDEQEPSPASSHYEATSQHSQSPINNLIELGYAYKSFMGNASSAQPSGTHQLPHHTSASPTKFQFQNRFSFPFSFFSPKMNDIESPENSQTPESSNSATQGANSEPSPENNELECSAVNHGDRKATPKWSSRRSSSELVFDIDKEDDPFS